MPTAAPAAPPAAPAADVPRHVAGLSDIQRCADSKKDDVMDRTSVNTQSWIAFRFQFYMALITRCNIWTQLNTLSPFTDAAPCVSHRYDAGKNSAASTPLTDDQAQHTARRVLLAMLEPGRWMQNFMEIGIDGNPLTFVANMDKHYFYARAVAFSGSHPRRLWAPFFRRGGVRGCEG